MSSLKIRIIEKFLEQAKNQLITDTNFTYQQFDYLYNSPTIPQFRNSADTAITYLLADMIYKTSPKSKKDTFIKDYLKQYNRSIKYLLNWKTVQMFKKEEETV